MTRRIGMLILGGQNHKSEGSPCKHLLQPLDRRKPSGRFRVELVWSQLEFVLQKVLQLPPSRISPMTDEDSTGRRRHCSSLELSPLLQIPLQAPRQLRELGSLATT